MRSKKSMPANTARRVFSVIGLGSATQRRAPACRTWLSSSARRCSGSWHKGNCRFGTVDSDNRPWRPFTVTRCCRSNLAPAPGAANTRFAVWLQTRFQGGISHDKQGKQQNRLIIRKSTIPQKAVVFNTKQLCLRLRPKGLNAGESGVRPYRAPDQGFQWRSAPAPRLPWAD